jgi:hypothetical protein
VSGSVYIEVRSSATRESDADAALRFAGWALTQRNRDHARDAVKAFRMVATWVWKSPAWERLSLAADRVAWELDRGTRNSWLPVLRREFKAVRAILEEWSGRAEA